MAQISEELWQLYCRSVLEVEIEPGSWHILFEPAAGLVVPESLVGELARSPATIVTAWNPYSTPRTYRDNVEANMEMAALLGSLGGRVRRAVGRAQNSEYEEPGFYVSNVSLDQVAGIARRFRQHALYVVMESEILCVTSDLLTRRSVGSVLDS